MLARPWWEQRDATNVASVMERPPASDDVAPDQQRESEPDAVIGSLNSRKQQQHKNLDNASVKDIFSTFYVQIYWYNMKPSK